MAAAQNQWLKQMCSPLHSMTELLTKLAATSLPHPSLSALLHPIWVVHNTLVMVHDSAPPKEEHPEFCRQPEFACFVTEFTSFLAALIPQLDRLGSRLSIVASSIGTAEEALFWELWRFLVAAGACFTFAGGQHSELLPRQPFDPHLYAAFNALLQWLLSISRSPAWLAMRKQHGGVHNKGELLAILAQPLNCIIGLSTTESKSILRSHLLCFPQTILPLLCCIISEQFTNAPMLVPRLQSGAGRPATLYRRGVGEAFFSDNLGPFLTSLVMLISNLANQDIITGHDGSFSFVTAPAVTHLLKTVLMLPQQALSSKSDLVSRCLQCLVLLISLCDKDMINGPSPSLPASDASSNQDAVGLPLHMIPRMSRHALETDVRLLHALSVHLSVDAGLTTLCFEVQALILRNWMLAGSFYPISLESVSVMVMSLVGVAKLCTLHGLHMLQRLKQDKARLLKYQIGRPREHKESSARSLDAHTASNDKEQVLPGLQEMNSIRTVMYHASDFTIIMPSYAIHPTTGM